ncbi:hypothetical protein AYO20_08187 [Fonsecaea nubica]|uniref:DUF7587 domain-containing protein n=1 Tax=Fonsecaea nubica TaxID=856822 RepID=A0A178CQT5_9EURO|nr:hypothetical protein AYO20_08187 [Fonsecaea nubica]OAL31644.1 hypothetical protein AYO20_08187 [Fonsecaea nubica]
MPTLQDWSRYNQYLREHHLYRDENGGDLYCCINEPLPGPPSRSSISTLSTLSNPSNLSTLWNASEGPPTPLEGPLQTYETMTSSKPRHPFRMVIYKAVPVEDAWLWKLSCRRVNMGAVSACTQAIVPRYLFRFWHDESGGGNVRGQFKSEREKQDMCADLEVMNERDIRDSLADHMRNRKASPFQSPWVSLSMSPLWVLAQALALRKRGCQNLKLAIIDTWHLKHGTYLFHAEALLRAYNVAPNLPFRNMGESMVLAWREIRAPMTVMRLDEILHSVLEGEYLKPGYLRLQPFHHKPSKSEVPKNHSVTKQAVNNNKIAKKRQLNKSSLRKPSEIRKKIHSTPSTYEVFQEIVLEQQAPWRFPRGRFAGRISQGKQPGRKTGHFRVPMAVHQLDDYVEFVKREVKAVEFQFPLLIALLSNRMAELERDSILDAIRDWGGDDPMVNAHKRCIVRDSSSPSLPELDAFEKLARDASDTLGIRVVENPGLRRFWVLQSPHTDVPHPRGNSEWIRDVVEGRERMQMRLKKEQDQAQEKAMTAPMLGCTENQSGK